MKKFGFTLAELLVALSIVGIASAISVPVISNVIPDKDKIVVLRYNKLIDNAIVELLNADGIYNNELATNASGEVAVDADGNPYYSCKGLQCTAAITYGPYAGLCSGTTKLSCLLKSKLDINASNKFTDGSVWNISNDLLPTITVTLSNMPAKRQCTYNASSCKKPGSFSFKVSDEYGNVVGNDPLTRAYMANPIELHNKKVDFAAAAANKYK